MTTTYENLNKWYTRLLDKFGRVMLKHMSYKLQSYENELDMFIKRSTDEMNLMNDIDRKRYLSYMISHIEELQNKLNTIKGIKGPIKRTRKTSAYNKFISENFANVKREHPEWNNENIMREVIRIWNERPPQMGGCQSDINDTEKEEMIQEWLLHQGGDDPYDYDIETAMEMDDYLTNKELEEGMDSLDYSGGEFEQNGGRKNKNDEMEKWKKQMTNLYL
jgi:hypothetical protein